MGRRPTDPRNFLRGTNRQGLGGSRRVRFHNGEYRSLGPADLIELRHVELYKEDSKEKNVNCRREAALTRTAKSLCAGPTTSLNLDSHMGEWKSCCVPDDGRRTTTFVMLEINFLKI